MEVKILQNALKANDSIAIENERKLKERKIFSVNMMSSPGSGKTTILEETIRKLGDTVKIAVIEGDVKTTMDADRLVKFGIPVVQINTETFGSSCHLDANMVSKGLDSIMEEKFDLLFVENVGNLVCPAGYKLGTCRNVVVLSVTEGEDKPPKYPLIFRNSDLLLINKTDLLPYLDFDMKKLEKSVREIKVDMEIFHLSAKSGEGLEQWIDWLKKGIKEARNGS